MGIQTRWWGIKLTDQQTQLKDFVGAFNIKDGCSLCTINTIIKMQVTPFEQVQEGVNQPQSRPVGVDL